MSRSSSSNPRKNKRKKWARQKRNLDKTEAHRLKVSLSSSTTTPAPEGPTT